MRTGGGAFVDIMGKAIAVTSSYVVVGYDEFVAEVVGRFSESVVRVA
jgi:Pyruvate/2-oxoacid:ferredoxin oxidoreductase gamma subunit